MRNPELVVDTISRIASSWDLVNIGIGIRVYNGSPIAEQVKRENPACIEDNFLHPVTFKPKSLSLKAIKAFIKGESFKYANFYMYDEDEATPLALLMIGTKLLQMCGSRQPIWKLFILLRRIEIFLGIRKLKELIWKIKQRKLL